jgi:hypothetical protein
MALPTMRSAPAAARLALPLVPAARGWRGSPGADSRLQALEATS